MILGEYKDSHLELFKVLVGFFYFLQYILCTDGPAVSHLSYTSLLLIFVLVPMSIKILFKFHQFT